MKINLFVAFSLLSVLSVIGCAKPTSTVSVLAQPIMTNVEASPAEDNEVVILGPVSSAPKAKETYVPVSFGSVTVTITASKTKVSTSNFCETLYEGKNFEDRKVLINGSEKEFFPATSIAYLTSDYKEITLTPRIEGKKILVQEVIPSRTGTPTVLDLELPASTDPELKGAKYTGLVRIAKLNLDWYLVLVETDRGTYAQCKSAPGYELIQ